MGFFKEIPPPFAHQVEAIQFRLTNNHVFDMSDPGTGKSRSSIDAFAQRRKAGGGKLLVIAPKSILKPSWGNDINKFAPELTYSIANAKNRKEAFKQDVDVYITNTDAVKWIADNLWAIDGCESIVVDESTAFKHRTSQRSKALVKIIKHFKHRELLSGTPNPNTVLDLWHQVFLLDEGEHLGKSFWGFRSSVCEPVQVGPSRDMVQWIDKPGSAEAIADIIEDITIRNKFEDCIDIPDHVMTTVTFDLSPKHQHAYDSLRNSAVLQLQDGSLSAINASALSTKLLQLTSGAVYADNDTTELISNDRYELVMELVEQREHCVVAFNWKHQKDELIKEATKRGISYAVIDGEANDEARQQAVDDFQAGQIKVIFAQPQSASHGLTLTRGTTTIWASPTYDAERFQQFNRRIYRAGQTKKTETIMIAANGTIDEQVYNKLNGKLDEMTTLLDLLQTSKPKDKAA